MPQLPPLFVSRTLGLGLEGCQQLIDALENTEPSVSVRPNFARPWLPDGAGEPVSWLDEARYLDTRPGFTFMPQLHQGRFYVQDASSMFISHVLRQITRDSDVPVTMLDACAAPGGKTTAAIDALPQGSLVVANEFDYRRASVLRENIIKWGSPSTVVTRGDTARMRRLDEVFDIVAVDAPCSGEGMFRKDKEAVAQWSESLVDECEARQREILDNVWRSLKPGGFLIYSTCTFNREENEEIVSWLLETREATSVRVDIDSRWGIVRSGLTSDDVYAYRFMPGLIRGEGLFMSVIKKDGVLMRADHAEGGRDRRRAKPDQAVAEASEWLENGDSFDVRRNGDVIEAVPSCHGKTMAVIDKNLDVIYRGVTLATVKGRDLIPDHSLAMSTALRRGAFVEVELDRSAALAYLRNETVALPEGTPRGFVLVTFDGYPLGFMKNIGNRANNLYPKEWRILSNIRD